MGKDNSTYLQSLGTLQLIAIVMVVVGHFGFKDNAFMNSVGVSFCFVYSGYFTALHHPFGASYSLGDHVRFMRNKLAKLYPIHLLAIALNIIIMLATGMITTVSRKTLFFHMTLLSSWIPNPDLYFGYNPVAWYICALFFLYLVAPLVVKLLRQVPVFWQVLLIIALIVMEYIGGYVPLIGEGHPYIGSYYVYQFPPIRLLDYATGIIIYNVGCTDGWKKLSQHLTPRSSTLLEIAAIVAFAILFWLGKTQLHTHCYRAYCASAPAIVTLFATFILTAGHGGALSQALCLKPLPSLCKLGAEVYLFQFAAYFSLLPLFRLMRIDGMPVIYVTITVLALLLLSQLIHRFYTTPLNRLLRARQ